MIIYFDLQVESLKKKEEKHLKIRQIYNSLPCKSLAEGQFIASQWLTSWLADDEKLGSFNNSALLCEHRKLNPDKFRDYKLISSVAVIFLLKFYFSPFF